MTVNTIESLITYQGNGSTTAWTFPFSYVDADTIFVSVTDSLGTVTQIPTTQYSIVLNPPIDPNPTGIGGVVNYPLTGSPLAVGSFITISRELEAVQQVSLSNQSIIYPPMVEREFDYLTMLRQQGVDTTLRAFRVGAQDPVPKLVPPVALRKNQWAFFDPNGDLIGASVPDGNVPISAAMQPVVGAGTTALARDLMGVTAAITAAVNSLFTTGDLKPTHKTTADPGWIMWSDGTIGNAGSGSTVRANADTQLLFTLYYGFAAADCPLFTSTGVATTRGAQGTASQAFTALCRIAMPKAAGRALSIAGNGLGLTNRPLGSNAGAELQTQLPSQMPSHRHTGNSGGEFFLLPQGPAPALFIQAQTDPSGTNIYLDADGFTGGGLPMSIMGPSTFVNIMVKL